MQSRSTIFFFFLRYIDVNEYRFLEQLAFTDIADSIPGLDSVQFPESSVHFERQRDLELRFGYIISRISNVFVRIKKTKKKKKEKKREKKGKKIVWSRERENMIERNYIRLKYIRVNTIIIRIRAYWIFSRIFYYESTR